MIGMSRPAGGTVLGETIRGLRKRLGITQEQLAEQTGISVRGIRNIEAGRVHAPRAGTLRVLADAFGLQGTERDRLLKASSRVAPLAPARQRVASGAWFSLPPDTAVFTGRLAELAAITAMVADAEQRCGVVAIHAIDGMPGVGKTALAVHAAHQLADRYPDGQMLVDLHAHTPGLSPTDPADALADLLRADGVDPGQLPDSTQARTALWRNRMAGRRALLVLDNVSATGQVSPLLPGSDGVLVLITSRRRLGDLRYAAHLCLEVLPHADAVALFVRLAPRAVDKHETAESVAELVQACDYLPLAIAILASRYAAHPSWTMADLHADFRNHRERLLAVKSENATVHAAFDLSYQQLPARRARFFHMLGLTPGVNIDAYAAAALTGTSFDDATEHLDQLYNDHLLDETAPRRYRMHDLIRAYAHTHAITTEPDHLCEQAIDRLLDYYQHTAHHADTLIAVHIRPATSGVTASAAAPDLSGWNHALAWLRTERPNLEACLRHATTRGQHLRVVGLTVGLTSLFYRDGPWTPTSPAHHNAARATAETGNRASQAGTTHDLESLNINHPTSDDLLHQALTIYTQRGDKLGRANTLHDLGRVRLAVGDYPAAGDLLHQALTIYTETGNQRGQAHTLHDLGVVRMEVGDYTKADNLLHQALSTYTKIGDRHGQANAFNNLGIGRRLAGDYRAADNLHHQALTRYNETGNMLGQANSLHKLGAVRAAVGDYPAAENLLRQALTIYTEAGGKIGQAFTLHDLAAVLMAAGDYTGAEDLLLRGLTTYTDIGNRHGQAVIRTQLGTVRYLTGNYTQAQQLLQQALTAIRDIGAPDDEAETLNHLGTLRRLTGHPDQAHTHHAQALTLARRIRHHLHEAHALEGIGRAAHDLGNPTTAIAHLNQALHLYQQLGAPQADDLTTTLADLNPTTTDQPSVPNIRSQHRL